VTLKTNSEDSPFYSGKDFKRQDLTTDPFIN